MISGRGGVAVSAKARLSLGRLLCRPGCRSVCRVRLSSLSPILIDIPIVSVYVSVDVGVVDIVAVDVVPVDVISIHVVHVHIIPVDVVVVHVAIHDCAVDVDVRVTAIDVNAVDVDVRVAGANPAGTMPAVVIDGVRVPVAVIVQPRADGQTDTK